MQNPHIILFSLAVFLGAIAAVVWAIKQPSGCPDCGCKELRNVKVKLADGRAIAEYQTCARCYDELLDAERDAS